MGRTAFDSGVLRLLHILINFNNTPPLRKFSSVRAYVCMCVCMNVRIYVYIRAYVYMYVRMYECMYVCAYVCMISLSRTWIVGVQLLPYLSVRITYMRIISLFHSFRALSVLSTF